MHEDLMEIRALVKGNVQGVGFRATIRQYALRMELLGSVKNLPDGSVEIYAIGEHQTVQNFMAFLRQGAGFDSVTDVTINEVSPHHTYHDFRIIF